MKVSVVMPVLDEEGHVGGQLRALGAQTYSGDWELVVVDNGCSDRTLDIVGSMSGDLPAVRVVATPRRRNLNHARNVGARAADGEFLAYCDADDEVAPEWLEALVAAAGTGDQVAGRLELERLNGRLTREWCAWDQSDGPPVRFDFLPYAPGGNCGVWASRARRLGWDEAFPFGSSDIEFSWRLQIAGGRIAWAPEAVVHRRFPAGLRELARTHYAYARHHPLLYRRFQRHGLGPSHREAAAAWWWLARRSSDLLRSSEARGRWVRLAARRVGRLEGSVRAGSLYL